MMFKRKKQNNESKDVPAAEENAAAEISEEKSGSGEAHRNISAAGVSDPSMISRLKRGLSKTRDILTTDIEDLFAGKLNEDTFDELEEILITADIGVQTTMLIIERFRKSVSVRNVISSEKLKETLKQEILKLLPEKPESTAEPVHGPKVVMVVGVNGAGKTTTIGKLANRYKSMGQTVLIAAGDTFRAAAVEQLTIWAERAGADIVKHKADSDPAAVAFDGVEAGKARKKDVIIVDTAGRLHTQKNLMEELKKIKRALSKNTPGAPHETLLVLDATTGQNAVSQARTFHEAIGITGVALAKLDGTARGGIVVGICSELDVPIRYLGVGEQIGDLQDFDPEAFVNALIE